MKRITIYIITYNQEEEIKRALDSILCQKDWGLHKIVVNDDCSPDNTWEVLLDYSRRYPDIVEPHRNEKNLGIYGNMAKVITLLPESDLYAALSGDDALCEGYFKGVQEFIKEKQINTEHAMGIYSDWESIFPDGRVVVEKQDAVLSGCRLWSLKARGIISNRGLLVSKKVMDRYEPMLKGRGLNLTEAHHDSQSHLNIDEAYYLPLIAMDYYAGIGVSSRLSLSESGYYTTGNIEKWEFGIEHYVKDKADLNYAKFEISKSRYYMHPSFMLYIDMLKYYHRGQLPQCRIPLRKSIRAFLGFIKYWILK